MLTSAEDGRIQEQENAYAEFLETSLFFNPVTTCPDLQENIDQQPASLKFAEAVGQELDDSDVYTTTIGSRKVIHFRSGSQ